MSIKKELDIIANRIMDEIACVESDMHELITTLELLEMERDLLESQLNAIKKIKQLPLLKVIK